MSAIFLSGQWVLRWLGNPYQGISSIIIEGHYLVALASEQNGEETCNVFTESDSNLRDNAVGREGCTVGYFGCHDSVSSVRVIPLQGNE